MSKTNEYAAPVHFKTHPSVKQELKLEAVRKGFNLSEYLRQIVERRNEIQIPSERQKQTA